MEGLGPLAARAWETPPVDNPVLSAVLFAHYAHETGGATMNVHTNRVAAPHTRGYIVGGEPDVAGRRIPTVTGGDDENLGTILEHRDRIRRLVSPTAQPRASVGVWHDTAQTDPVPEWDASAIYRDRRSAVARGRVRGERAVWDLKRMADIRLDEGES